MIQVAQAFKAQDWLEKRGESWTCPGCTFTKSQQGTENGDNNDADQAPVKGCVVCELVKIQSVPVEINYIMSQSKDLVSILSKDVEFQTSWQYYLGSVCEQVHRAQENHFDL